MKARGSRPPRAIFEGAAAPAARRCWLMTQEQVLGLKPVARLQQVDDEHPERA
jgi:hypothetical protein